VAFACGDFEDHDARAGLELAQFRAIQICGRPYIGFQLAEILLGKCRLAGGRLLALALLRLWFVHRSPGQVGNSTAEPWLRCSS
jgi:hypothetical protein